MLGWTPAVRKSQMYIMLLVAKVFNPIPVGVTSSAFPYLYSQSRESDNDVDLRPDPFFSNWHHYFVTKKILTNRKIKLLIKNSKLLNSVLFPI